MSFLDRIPLVPLAIFAVLLALMPFVPQPHLFEKIGLLFDGSLSRPLDIFDLFWHSWLLVVLVLKLFRLKTVKLSE